MKVIVDYLAMAYGGYPHKHAQKVMQDLGIEYKKHVANSITDNWVFYGCTMVPENLPAYVRAYEEYEEYEEYEG